MSGRDDANLRTGTPAFVGQREERPDPRDGEAEGPSAADEGQALEVIIAVEPIAPRTSGGGRQFS